MYIFFTFSSTTLFYIIVKTNILNVLKLFDNLRLNILIVSPNTYTFFLAYKI